MGPDVLYALFTVFTLTYGIQALGYERNQVLTAVLIGSAFQLFMIPLAGAVSDRFNRRLVYGTAAVVGAVWTFIFFGILGGDNEPMLIVGIVLGLMAHSFMYGPQAAFIVEQFSPRLRSTGSSLAYTFAGVIGGAIAPLMFTLLLSQFGTWIPVAIYVAVAAAVTAVGLALGRDSNTVEDEDYRLLLEGSAAARQQSGRRANPKLTRPGQLLGAEQDVPGDGQVMVNGLLRLRGVAGHQGIEDVLVFGAHLPAPAAGAEQRGDAHQDLPDMELAVGAGDELIAGGVDQLLVEEGVQPDELPRSLRVQLLGKLGLLVQGVLHRLRRNAALFDDQAGGMAFQHTAQFHQLGHFAARHRRNIGSALRNQFHQAVGDEQQERFPDRSARDADLGGQLLLVQELPLHLRVDQDVFPQVRVRLLAAGRRRPRTFSHTLCIQQTGVISCV